MQPGEDSPGLLSVLALRLESVSGGGARSLDLSFGKIVVVGLPLRVRAGMTK